MKHYSKKFQKIKKIIENESPIIVEIGAHYGEDALRFLKIFPDSRIFCFEPDGRNIEIFDKIVKNQNISLIQMAVSDKNGYAKFYRSYITSGNKNVPDKYNFISQDDYYGFRLNGSGASSLKKGFKNCLNEEYFVKTIRFDDWYIKNELEIVDFVWIDVQGNEKEVIDGMNYVLKNTGHVWIEYGEMQYDGAMNRVETIELFKDKGFHVNETLSSQGDIGDLMFYKY